MRCLAWATLVLSFTLGTSGAFGNDDAWITYQGDSGPGKGRRIVLVSGDEEYRSEEALPQLARILSAHHGFTCTVLFAIDEETGLIDPEHQTNIPGLAALEQADLMVIATRFRALPDEQMAHIDRYVRSGRPIVGLRTATHAFALKADSAFQHYSWNCADEGNKGGFGRKILGETWIAHHGDHGRESTRGVMAPGAADHPIARGLKAGSVWGPTDVYTVRQPLPDGCVPIVLGQVLDGMTPQDEPTVEKNDPMMPIAWIRTQTDDDFKRPRRVFTATMGAATDLISAGTRRMIVNGAYWALGLEASIPESGTAVELVGAYAPSPFGFGAHRRGQRPADFALPTPVDP